MSDPSLPALLVLGAGRMGQAVLAEAARDPRWRVAGVVRRGAEPVAPPGTLVFSDLAAALAAAPGAVVVDVSAPSEAAPRILRVAAAGHPLVEGTTGLPPQAETALAEAAARIAVVIAPNLSPGAALLRAALRAVESAGLPAWDAGILDRHHAGKKDAPSGTARELAALLTPGRARPPEVISLRQGNLVGEHSVYLAALDEELILTHRVASRQVFARGALLAAAFAATARPGRYGMDQVLGLPGR